MKLNLFTLLFLGFYEFLLSLLYITMYKRYSKKCNYKCVNCKVWDCPAHYCNAKRKEIESVGE